MRPLDGFFDRILDGGRGRSGEFNLFVNGVFHVHLSDRLDDGLRDRLFAARGKSTPAIIRPSAGKNHGVVTHPPKVAVAGTNACPPTIRGMPLKPGTHNLGISGFGRVLFGTAVAGLALLALVYGNFAPLVEPFPAWLPWPEVWACGLGSILLAAGAGVLFARTAFSSAMIIGVYGLPDVRIWYSQSGRLADYEYGSVNPRGQVEVAGVDLGRLSLDMHYNCTTLDA